MCKKILATFAKNKKIISVFGTKPVQDMSKYDEHIENNEIHVTAEEKKAWDGKANKSDIPAAYNLPTASEEVLGGIKVGENLEITENGVLNATGGIKVLEATASNKINLDEITTPGVYLLKWDIISSITPSLSFEHPFSQNKQVLLFVNGDDSNYLSQYFFSQKSMPGNGQSRYLCITNRTRFPQVFSSTGYQWGDWQDFKTHSFTTTLNSLNNSSYDYSVVEQSFIKDFINKSLTTDLEKIRNGYLSLLETKTKDGIIEAINELNSKIVDINNVLSTLSNVEEDNK